VKARLFRHDVRLSCKNDKQFLMGDSQFAQFAQQEVEERRCKNERDDEIVERTFAPIGRCVFRSSSCQWQRRRGCRECRERSTNSPGLGQKIKAMPSHSLISVHLAASIGRGNLRPRYAKRPFRQSSRPHKPSTRLQAIFRHQAHSRKPEKLLRNLADAGNTTVPLICRWYIYHIICNNRATEVSCDVTLRIVAAPISVGAAPHPL
jgi:hypothetical protein